MDESEAEAQENTPVSSTTTEEKGKSMTSFKQSRKTCNEKWSNGLQNSLQGGTIESEVSRLQREMDELKNMLEKCTHYLTETQGDVQLLIAEGDNIKKHYCQAQEKITDLRLELLKTSQLPKPSEVTLDALQRTADERDEVWSNLHCVNTERDRLQETLQLTQETAKGERDYREQRIDVLQNALLTAEEEIAHLRHQLLKASEFPKPTGVTSDALKRTAAERDEAWSNLHCVTIERDSLQELLKDIFSVLSQFTQEKARGEKTYLEQRIKDLQNALLTLEQERWERNKTHTQMTDAMAMLKTQVISLGKRLEASQQEVTRLKTEYSMLSSKYTQLGSELYETQQQLPNRIRELDAQRNKQLNESNDSLRKLVSAQNGELNVLHSSLLKLENDKKVLQEQLDKKSELLRSVNKQLKDKDGTIYTNSLKTEDCKKAIEALRETVIRRENEIDFTRKKLLETQSKLLATVQDKDAALERNIELIEELDQSRMDKQVLKSKMDEGTQMMMMMDLKKTLKNCVSDISHKENLLISTKLDSKQLEESCKQALVQAERWEKQAKETEAEITNTLKSGKSELKEKVAYLENSLEKLLSAQVKCNTDLFQLNHTLQQQNNDFSELQKQLLVTQSNLEKTCKLCIKLDADKEVVQQELNKCRTEVESLRKQLADKQSSMK